jgi:S1-C subfamily serine protease
MSANRTFESQLVRPSSYRYTGFAHVVASDLPTRPEHCGAPVVDANGQVVGILIARAMFIESLVLPADDVTVALARMQKQVAYAK